MTMFSRLVAIFTCIGLLLAVPSARLWAGEQEDEHLDLYGEELPSGVKEAPGWKEDALVLPAYPRRGAAIAVDLRSGPFPYRVSIDPASLSVGDDRVVRYTVLLESASGVVNVFYEGIRCDTLQYRRYAYGVGGRLKPFTQSRWRYIRRFGSDRLHAGLAEGLLCPLPVRDRVSRLLERLKRTNPDTQFSDDDF